MKHQEEYLAILRNLKLMDDDFFNVCFADNIEATQLILRIILNRDDLTVISVETQTFLKNIHGRSVRLDAYAKDSTGKAYNIEIQRSDKGAQPRRARYNSSLMDADISVAGEAYEELADSYVIFITEHDILKGGLPVYTFERTCQETGKSLGDGSHIVYVNGAYRDESPIGRLMADFDCTSPDDMYYPALTNQVRYFKEHPKGVTHMCKAFERLKYEGRLEGRAEGRAEGRLEGRAEGRAEANAEAKLKHAKLMYELGKLTQEELVTVFELTPEQAEAIVSGK